MSGEGTSHVALLEELGIRRVVNAAAAQTKLGGAMMPEPVLAAMRDAARYSVDLSELHDRVGERIADLTGNEAACCCCGAAAGLLIAAAACLAGDDPEHTLALPDTSRLDRREIVVWKSQWTGFLSAVRQAGATLVEIGPGEQDLEAALSERTAAVLWFAGANFAEGALPLPDVIRVSHARGVPVIVDAADQIPPVSNLWHYTRDLGADLAIFSGGKGLLGPQASGVITGRKELIAACRANGGPFHSIGRPAKVGKEEMAGLLAAIELAVAKDEAREREEFRATVDQWAAILAGTPGVTLEIFDTSHSGQPIPRLIVAIDDDDSQRRDRLIASLWDLDPRVAVLPSGTNAVALNPQLVRQEDRERVATSIRAVLESQAH